MRPGKTWSGMIDSPDRACEGMDTELFDDLGFAQRINWAKAICATCPVKAQCLELAIENAEPWGVWGGFTTLERDRLRANDGARTKLCTQCGTEFISPRSQCNVCVPPHTAVHGIRERLMEHRDMIERLAGEGYGDQVIADRMSVEINEHVPRETLRNARRALFIPPGPTGKGHGVSFDETKVDRVQDTGEGFGQLTAVEQVELMQRWLTPGARRPPLCEERFRNGNVDPYGSTASGFARTYNCSGDRAGRLRTAVHRLKLKVA